MVKRTKGETIDAILLQWRNGRGLSQREAAKMIGAHQGRWAKWETGRERPGPAYLQAIARASGGALTLDALVEACARGIDGRAA